MVAFGALTPYRPKPSYAHTVENSVYVREGWRGKGLGGLVLDRLVALATARGPPLGHRAHHRPATRPRWPCTSGTASSAVGLERQVAFKHGIWLDVVTLQRILID